MRPAVFLDRDGTMVRDVGYLSRLEDLHWFPYTVDAVRLLNRAGFLVFVTTNQGGVGLGFYPEAFVRQTHEEMAAYITAGGGRVDGWYYCPHHPRATIESLRVDCDCRKPAPGMVRQAQQRFAIDLARSFVVGDKAGDLGLARSVGARGVLVRTGYGEVELARMGDSVQAARLSTDLMEATSWILEQAAAPAGGA
ncbi:MAG TPA: HAD family hydrolase [Vicinamibacterales bacterium]|nr:HAD family hydrolase [Vicinamibacterales bacterium]